MHLAALVSILLAVSASAFPHRRSFELDLRNKAVADAGNKKNNDQNNNKNNTTTNNNNNYNNPQNSLSKCSIPCRASSCSQHPF
jgi:hypothetical protein